MQKFVNCYKRASDFWREKIGRHKTQQLSSKKAAALKLGKSVVQVTRELQNNLNPVREPLSHHPVF
ncbi:Uncharacterised protein [Legionella pneumophila]|nr:Uncharacterised protein [Legionella pneumophila]CZI28272.1 Uncharacterised protein [Legionella pneumophila]CZI66524.1 Uncharacterised protein [Legionella pneumophila]CZR04270.1 Uncharacterised protein [Legionella pneumophila]STX65784.1 Uncharacterised protein [Legionella pneumophila]